MLSSKLPESYLKKQTQDNTSLQDVARTFVSNSDNVGVVSWSNLECLHDASFEADLIPSAFSVLWSWTKQLCKGQRHSLLPHCSKLLWKYHNPAQSINILCLVSVGQSFDHQTMIHDMRSLALKTSCCLFDVPGPQRMPNSAAWWPGAKWQMLHEDHDLHDCLCNLLSICVWSDCPFQILEQQIHQLKHDISDISVSCNSHQFSKTNTSFIISHMFLVYKWISVLVLRWTNLLSYRAFFQEKLDFVLHLEKTQCEMSNGLGNQNVSTSPSAFRFFEGLEEHSENQRPSKHFTPLIMQNVSQRHNMLQ